MSFLKAISRSNNLIKIKNETERGKNSRNLRALFLEASLQIYSLILTGSRLKRITIVGSRASEQWFDLKIVEVI